MISDAIKQARVLARKAQEATYDGICTVVEYQKVKDHKTKMTTDKEVVILEREPCRLSYSNISTVEQTESAEKHLRLQNYFCHQIYELNQVQK